MTTSQFEKREIYMKLAQVLVHCRAMGESR